MMFFGAIEQGVRRGFEAAAEKLCSGREHPDERCPNRIGECVCAYVAWRNLPWWKEPFRKEPPRPDQDTVLDIMFSNAIKKAMENG